ncbi:MAG: rod shape-determining protein MreD [Oceanospirillales bacterium LUC14_002_19_P2]|nr:MAG: rod shape-determining protein MreD [Oceanospirillales bacterium LUC14_002_19_P2]
MYRTGHHWLVWLTLLLAAVLSIIPLPPWLSLARPAWMAMAVMFWLLVLPQNYGVFFAWCIGLLMDVMLGVVLGQNAIAMLILAMATHKSYRRLRLYPLWQQTFMVLVIIGLYQLICLWINSAIGHIQPSLIYVLPAVTSALLWPWLSLLLHSLRRRFGIV